MQRSAAAAETIRRAQEASTVRPAPVPARLPNRVSPMRHRRARTRSVDVDSVALSLVGTHDLVELCRLLHQAVARHMEATIFFLGLYDPASETVEVVWQIENGRELPGGSFPLGKGFTSDVLRTGQARLIKQWSREGPRVQVQYATGT